MLRKIFGAAIMGLVAFLVIVVLENWKRPECKAGYVAIDDLINGWFCVSGYKP
jgi:hypothetical protein